MALRSERTDVGGGGVLGFVEDAVYPGLARCYHARLDNPDQL